MIEIKIYHGLNTEVEELLKKKSKVLFNQTFFLKLQDVERVFFIAELNGETKAIWGFACQEKILISPYRATFGGIEFIGTPMISITESLLNEVLVYAKKHERSIEVTLPPLGIMADEVALQQLLFTQKGFYHQFIDENFHLNVSTKEQFVSGTQKNVRWRLNKLVKQGYSCVLDKSPDIARYHQFIQTSRAYRGFPMTMSKEEFMHQMGKKEMPVQFFHVMSPTGKWIAVSVCLFVTPSIFYNFYSADLEEDREMSPTILLHHRAVQFCEENHIPCYDLGIASVQGEINKGLADFKYHLGGERSDKITYRLNNTCQNTNL